MKQRYKNITIGLSLALCVATGIFAVSADNYQNSDTLSKISEISEALDTSLMLNSAYNTTSANDEEDEFDENSNAFSFFSNKNEPEYDETNMIKLYGISNITNVDSIYDNLSDSYGYLVPVEKDNAVISYAVLKKGKKLQEVKDTLNLQDLSEEEQQKIYDTIASRENKWYVSYIKEAKNIQSFVFDDDALNAYLKNSGITDVVDYKHIRVSSLGINCIVVKTNNSEFVLPYTSTDDNGICEISDFLSIYS